MLNIVIPMAGLGSRFAQAGYRLPKPLIPVHGMPMIRLVIGNIRPTRPHRFIFICQQAHDRDHALADQLAGWAPGCALVWLDHLTEGAACTVLAARSLINDHQPLMIANSDQYVDTRIDGFLAMQDRDMLDGLIMTMPASDPKWSYAALGRDGLVTRVAEKQPISPHATVGIYSFARGCDFVRAADRMIARNDRVGGEFYVAPAYNQLISEGARIGVHDVGAAMHGLGIPADLNLFLANPVSQRATEPAL
jgi:NDP-sugar pyrophosphorylase family protein